MVESWKILKRCIAMVLTFAILLSCSNMGFISHVHAVEEQSNPSISLGDIIAGNYELSQVEKNVLQSGALSADVKFEYTLPPEEATDDDGLVVIDRETSKVTVNNFVDEIGNTWVPAAVTLEVNGETVETIVLTDGKGTYTYDGNAFAVVVEYALTGGSLKNSITQMQQLALLNAVVYLSQDVDYMQMLDKDTFAQMSGIQLTPNSFLDTMSVKNPALDNQTPIDLVYSLVEGYVKSVTLPGDTQPTVISVKLEGDAVSAAESLKAQQDADNMLAMPKFFKTHGCSYLEMLYNDGYRNELHAALDKNIGDISGLLADGGLKDVYADILNIQNVTLPELEESVYGMINAEMPTVIGIVGQIPGIEGDVDSLAEVKLIQAAVKAFYNEKLEDANNQITDKVEAGQLDETLIPEGGIQEAADLKELIENVKAAYEAGLEQINGLLTAYGASYGIAFPKVNSSADIDAVKAAVDSYIGEKINELNETVEGYNTSYAEYDLNLPTVGYTGLENLDDTAADVQALQSALANAKTKLEAVLPLVNGALDGYGYTGTDVQNSADIDAVIMPWLDGRLQAEKDKITAALLAANGILDGTAYSDYNINSAADIDAVITLLTGDASDELKAAQQVVADKVAAAQALAKSLGYPNWDKIASSNDVDAVGAWLEKEIADDKADHKTYVEMANGYLAEANKQLPEEARYDGTITDAASIDGVITWMNESVAKAEKAYSDALTAFNALLTSYGYTGAQVTDPAQIDTVVKPELENAKETLEQEIADKLASLNSVLAQYGYQKEVTGSADIDDAIDYMNNSAEAYIWAQVNSKLPAGAVNSVAQVGTAKNALSVALAMNQISQDDYNKAVAALDAAVAAVENISTVVNTLTAAKAPLQQAEAAKSNINTALAGLDTAKTNLTMLKELRDTAAQMKELYAEDLTTAQKALKNLETQIANAEAALPGQKAQLNAAKADIVAAEEALENVDDPNATIIPALRDEQSKITAAEAEIATVNAQKTAMAGWKTKLQTVEQAQAGIAAAQTLLASLYELLTDEEDGAPAMLAALEEAKATLKTAEDAIALLEENYELMVDAEQKMAMLDEAVAGIAELEEYKGLLDQYVSYLPVLIGILEDFGEAVAPVADRFDANAWTVKNHVKSGANFTKLTDWATVMIGTPLYEEEDLLAADSLTVATANTQYNMSMFTVTMVYSAQIVNPNKVDSNELYNLITYQPEEKITLEAGATKAQIVQAILNAGHEATALERWAAYEVNATNFERIESVLPDALTQNITYTVRYEPKTFTVTYDGMTGAATVLYGYRVSLPICETEGQEYEYTVNGQKYYQGQIVKITGNTHIVRVQRDKSTDQSLLQLVVNATQINDYVKQILGSSALVYAQSVPVRFPGAGLVSVNGAQSTIIADDYYYGIGEKSWRPVSAVTKNLNGGVLENISSFTDGKAVYTEDFAVAEVLYKIAFTAPDLNISENAILKAMNLANVLTNEYVDQKAALDYLSADQFMQALSMLDGKDTTVMGYLQMAQTAMATDPAKPALDAIISDLNASSNGKLTLYNLLFNYKEQGMAYYYKNDARIRSELDKMQNAMETLTSSESFMNVVKSNDQALHDKLVAIKADLLSVNITAKNGNIVVTNDTALKQLVADLDAYSKVTRTDYTSVGTMEWSTTLTATVGVKIVTVNVQWGAKSESFTINFVENQALTAGDIQNLMNKLVSVEDAMGVDKSHYLRTGLLPEIGDVLTEDMVYNIVWDPKAYDIIADGNVIGSVTYEDPYFELPGHANSEYRYDYTVGGQNLVQGDVLNLKDNFDAYFASGSLTLERQEVDKIREQLINFVDRMQGAVILTEHGNRKYSLVLKIDPATVSDNMSMFVMGMLMSGYGYIGMDGEMFFGTIEGSEDPAQFHLQTMVDMIMNSGMGTQTIIDMYGANGFKNLALSGNIISNHGGNMNALGGKLLHSSMSFGTSADDALAVDFYVTMPDGEALKSIHSALDAAKGVISVAFQNGQLEAKLNLPEPVYAAYLAALTMVGETDLRSIDEINAEIALGYLFTLIDPLIGEEDVTTETFENTLAMFDKNVDLSKYAQIYEKMKSIFSAIEERRTYTQAGCVFTFDDVSINVLIDWAQENIIAKLAAGFGVSSDDIKLSNMIYEYKPAGADESRDDYGLDVQFYAELSNLHRNYAALFVDVKGNGLSNKVGMLTAEEIAGGALNRLTGPAFVILLADIDHDVVISGKTVIDLNGKTIDGKLTANATTILTDNYYLDAEPGGVTGAVSGNVTIIDGVYGTDVSAFLLNGYEQNKQTGAVSNLLYTITSDSENNITVTLHTNASSLKELASLKSAGSLGLDIALDLILNHYNMAALAIGPDDGELCKIYDIRFDDIINMIAGEDRLTNGINTILSHTSLSDLADLLNAVTDDLTDFAALEAALNGDGIIAKYKTETAVWQVGLEHIENGDYMSLILSSNDNRKSGSLTLAIDGGLTDDLATLMGALADTVVVDSELDLDDLEIDENGLLELAGSYKGTIDIDFTVDRNYVIMMAVILAHGNASVRDEMVNAIETYYESNETSMADLEDVFKALSAADICDALANTARTELFTDMVADLGLTGVVDDAIGNDEMGYGKVIDVLGIGLRLLKERNLLESIIGSQRTLGSFEKSDDLGDYFGFSTSASSERYKDIFGGYSVGYSLALSELSIKLRLFSAEDLVVVSNASGKKLGAFDNLADAFAMAAQNPGCTITVTGGVTADQNLEVVNQVKLVGAKRITFADGVQILLDGAEAKLISDKNIDANVVVADSDNYCLKISTDGDNTVYVAAEHSYEEEGWEWTADENSATAKVTFVCSSCGKTETVDAVVGKGETQEENCCENGFVKYTASVQFKGLNVSDEYTYIIVSDPENHQWVRDPSMEYAPTWTANGVTNYYYCSNGCGGTKSDVVLRHPVIVNLGNDVYGGYKNLEDAFADVEAGAIVLGSTNPDPNGGMSMMMLALGDIGDYDATVTVTQNVALNTQLTVSKKVQLVIDTGAAVTCGEHAGIKLLDGDARLDSDCDLGGAASGSIGHEAVKIYDIDEKIYCYSMKAFAVYVFDGNGVIKAGTNNLDDAIEYALANGLTVVQINSAVTLTKNVNINGGHLSIVNTNLVTIQGNVKIWLSQNGDYIELDNLPAGMNLMQAQMLLRQNVLTTNPSCGEIKVTYSFAPVTLRATLVLEHDFTVQDTSDVYLASNATCVDNATYYYSCSRCGAAGTQTFEAVGTVDPNAHKDADKDHECDYGCDVFQGVHEDTNLDHVCDYCGEKMSDCDDADNDHICDECGSVISVCKDDDDDGFCDICGKELNPSCVHIDADNDHLCDNCGETVSVCKDNDNDHLCDVCGEKLTDCEDTDNDHFCDACGERVSDCEDAEPDHECDICGGNVGDHVDANTDHICDYGCSVSIGAHVDAEKDHDHVCDYCGVTMNACADADNDHFCDECDTTVSTCIDANGDDFCDICGKDLDPDCVHNDADNDHLCDICGETVSVCKDNDNDHYCDICGDELSDCEDNDNDHYCDICGDELSDCEDNDNDHYCDICGDELSDCEDNDNDHYCDICGDELSDCEDNDNDHYCDICGDELSVCGDNDNDHLCDVCGATVSQCRDDDGDDFCDICGADLDPDCVHNDANNDHYCDICNEIVSSCKDNDNDHNCDICGKELSTCEDADNDGDHNCDICGKEDITQCVDPEKDHTCNECGNDIGTCEDADKDHHCDYGCDASFGTCEDADKDHHCDYGCNKYYGEHIDTNNDHVCEYGCDKAIGDHADGRDRDHVCDYCFESVGEGCYDDDKDHACDECGGNVGVCGDTDLNHYCDYGCGKYFGVCEDAVKDHYCDYGCGKYFGVCQDADTDHDCDYGCDEYYGTCEDADKDHDCDYGCDKQFGTCEDADMDHDCDYGCSKYFGEHKDANKDHNCDYGCSVKIGTCEDADKDHDCDYGCNKYFGEHTDADKDHNCDYGCSIKIGTCEDADKDHDCDYGCNEFFGTCEDADKDHNCDYGCNKYFGEHKDANKDHNCDYGCSVKIGTCEDADKDHDCDYGCNKYFGVHKDTNKDHNCDYGCAVKIGTCEDADKDHDCDYGCDKAFGEHKDANKDHNCDYGCTEKIGTCEDGDLDHDCDYGCDKAFGEHKDANKDHICDYGCSEKIGTCKDADKDHDCDYGCNKYYGEHKDTDKDHKCDYGCSVKIGTCKDADKDHKCDYGCGKSYGEHKDADKDHKCDYGCTEKIGTCEDKNHDHNCDYGCDSFYGKHQDVANDGNHNCDYCGKKIGDCADKNNNHRCDECGKTLSDCVDKNKDGVCDICGENMSAELVKPTIGAPVVTIGNKVLGYQVDEDNEILYLDSIASGITVAELEKLLVNTTVTDDDDNRVSIVVSDKDGNLLNDDLVPTGATVTLIASNGVGETIAVYEVGVIGDVNCNGRIDNNDTVLTRLHYLNVRILTGLALDVADTNRNNKIDNNDMVLNTVKSIRVEAYRSRLEY